ncbi:peroxisome assembly protein 26 isoform X2 [Amia ocellicauda]|uniref:peroxisome assembly protein 26 isoform X2 n=1 Tax=Amia ocellicauda TaxID=2972642 RepID=UPI0034639478
MRSSSSTSLAQARSLGSVRLGSSPLLFQGSAQALSLLDMAVEHLMVLRDFKGGLESCEKGLDSLSSLPEHEDTTSSFRCGEVKAALCIIGIQALAELNEWRRVLAWVLQYYGTPEKIPAKIMQMCILLYTKVDEPGMILEAGGDWLRTSVNQSLPGYGAVAELYLLHILVPLGWLHEAQVLAGSYTTFTEEQRQVALEIIERKKNASSPQSLSQGQGIQQRMHIPIPSAFPWISDLFQMFRQMWEAMFAPYYRVSVAC